MIFMVPAARRVTVQVTKRRSLSESNTLKPIPMDMTWILKHQICLLAKCHIHVISMSYLYFKNDIFGYTWYFLNWKKCHLVYTRYIFSCQMPYLSMSYPSHKFVRLSGSGSKWNSAGNCIAVRVLPMLCESHFKSSFENVKAFNLKMLKLTLSPLQARSNGRRRPCCWGATASSLGRPKAESSLNLNPSNPFQKHLKTQ